MWEINPIQTIEEEIRERKRESNNPKRADQGATWAEIVGNAAREKESYQRRDIGTFCIRQKTTRKGEDTACIR